MKKVKSLFSIILSMLCICSLMITGFCENIVQAETTTQKIQDEPTTQVATENEKVPERLSEVVTIESAKDNVYIYERFTVEVKIAADVSEWNLKIECPDDIKIISGDTTLNSDVSKWTKSTNLILMAKRNGPQKIKIIGSVYYKDTIGEEQKITEVKVDKQITINAILKPDSMMQDLGEGNESTNCRLKLISTDVGVISPFFNSDKMSYILIVPENAKTVTVSAEAESSKTTIEGTGEYDLTKTNEILICSTAANGNIRTYSLKILKGYKVLFQQELNGECISLIDIGGKNPPDNFSVSNMSVEGQMISVWLMPFFDYRIVRGITSAGTEEYYAYNTKTNSVTGLFLNVKQDGKDYIYVGVDGIEPNAENLDMVKRSLYGKTIDCYQYNDISLEGIVILPLYDTESRELNFYEYNIKLDKISLSQEFRQEAEATSEELPTVSVAVITSIMPVDSHTVKSLKESLKIRDTIILVMLGILVLAAIAFFVSIISNLSYRRQKLNELFGEDDEFLQLDEK